MSLLVNPGHCQCVLGKYQPHPRHQDGNGGTFTIPGDLVAVDCGEVHPQCDSYCSAPHWMPRGEMEALRRKNRALCGG